MIYCKKDDDNTDCIDENLVNPNGVCTKEYKPVCGCNNITYSNACEADKAGVRSYLLAYVIAKHNPTVITKREQTK